MAVQEQQTMGGGELGISVGRAPGWLHAIQAGGRREITSRRQLQERPGHSQMVYMQHRYTPLDSRIIIITAAILVLLLCVLFLNFFIRWALRRVVLMRADKLLDSNKGLSKRQVQALPSFIYSSSTTPSLLCSCPPYLKATPCHDKNFHHDLLKPTLITPQYDLHNTKVDPPPKINDSSYSTLSRHNANKLDHNVPPSLVDHHNPTFDPSSSQQAIVDELHPIKDCLTKSHHLDSPINNIPPTSEGMVVSHIANPLTCFNSNNLPIEDNEVLKANLPINKDGHSITTFDKVDQTSNYGHDNANSTTLCPICLSEYIDGDIVRVLPSCKHYFHTTCIDMWLAKNSSCPACREKILGATQTQVKRPNLQVHVIISTTS